MSKLRVGVIFGGRSGEHEVSLLSAASVIRAIDKSKYEVVPIGITRTGQWLTSSHAERLLAGKPLHEPRKLRAGDPSAVATAEVFEQGEVVIVPPVPRGGAGAQALAPFQATPGRRAGDSAINVDVIFPVLHGTFGEDGTIQGLLELADIPYVGAGVLGSAVGMDKEAMKRMFIAAGLPIVKHLTVLRGAWKGNPKKVRKQIEHALKYPIFVKPANLGSSVGISKVHEASELSAAMHEAARFDRKIVIEQAIGTNKSKAREIEVSVLGNDEPEASIAGEIVPSAEFYDYQAKYIDEGSKLLIPAKLSKPQMKKVRDLAVKAFQAVDCTGLARVDFLMDPKTEKLYVNEINTMPGFTSISMYPKLWAASGLEYTQLITRLVELAMERHAEKQRNEYSK